MATATSTSNIVCPGCGASYRLPRSFSKPSAKCKRCQAVIPLRQPTKTREASAAAAALRSRSTRAHRALGVRAKTSVSPIHVATGVVTLAALVIIAIMGLS